MNVILIGIDALRADHLGCYGYRRNTSPNIDALAQKGVRFKKCFSQAYLTAPSFMSIMTSRYPTYHGVTSNISGAKSGCRAEVADSGTPILAEILKNNGYRTAAFTDGGNLYGKLGFSRGFDYYSINRGFGKRKAIMPENDILYWLEENKDNDFFLFFHTYSVHSPWVIPEKYRNAFGEGGAKFYHEEKPENIAAEYADMYAREISEYLELLTSIAGKNNAENVEYLKDLYDCAILYVDQFIGRVTKFLEDLVISDKTIIIFTADHGEEFFEHGKLSHQQFYNELLSVPLIIYAPGANSTGFSSDTARSIDIYPTILGLLSIKISHPIHGLTLFPEKNDAAKHVIISELGERGMAIQGDKYKYICQASDELYNLTNDPTEKNNIASDHPDTILKMRSDFNEELRRPSISKPQKNILQLSGNRINRRYESRL